MTVESVYNNCSTSDANMYIGDITDKDVAWCGNARNSGKNEHGYFIACRNNECESEN